MNFTQIASADLKRIIALVEQKETLQAHVAKIDVELGSFEAEAPAAPVTPAARAKGKPGRKPGRQAKGRRPARGALKASILELLTAAGKAGTTVKEIAAKLNAKPTNIHVWFSSTGKTIKEIKKLGPGKFGWTGAAAPVAAPAAAEVAEPKAQKRAARKARTNQAKEAVAQRPAAQKAKAKKAGGTKEAIIELVKGAGKPGITVKEIAARLGVKTQGVYVWFGTTGRKVEEIKKIAPATYAWAV
jgi:transposase-like protein